jgi:hypothetical protein
VSTQARRWPLIGLALLVVSIVLAQVFKVQLLELLDVGAPITRITPPRCDLNRDVCLLPILTPVASEAPWSFGITPRPIPVSNEITLTLTPPDRTLPGNRPAAVWVDLTGDSMDMGLIRIPLTQNTTGQWVGTGSIPVCVTGQMRWRARLQMKLAQTTLQADWLFDAPVFGMEHGSKAR